MRVKFNGEVSEFLKLVGGGPQGALLGETEYLVQSNDNADTVKPEDRFKYIDDLSKLQLILLSGILMDYKIHEHIPSDIAIDEKFLPPSSLKIQENLNEINSWTQKNLMRLNPTKCNYMIFSRSKEKFSTRLKIGDSILKRRQT